MSKAQEYVKEWLVNEKEPSSLIGYHYRNYPTKLDRDFVLRDYFFDCHEEIESLDNDQLRYVLVDTFWQLEWNKLGDLVDLIAEDFIRYNESQEIDLEDLECSADFLDRLLQ